MLGKSKKNESDKAVSPDRPVEGKSPTFLSSSTAREEKTIIGENISIEGSIRGEENLEIEGSMKGKIDLEKHNFRVGLNGQVEGEVNARNVSISGEFKGNIKSHEKVEITRKADFYGEIKAKSISIEDGAGTGRELDYSTIVPSPSFVAFDFKFDFLGDARLALSILTRQKMDFEFSTRLIDSLDILPSPGKENFAGGISIDRNFDEVWGGLTYSSKLNEMIKG